MPRNPIIPSLGIFILVFTLLIFPWPGWNELYGHYFRSIGKLIFSRDNQQRIVLFEPYHEDHEHPNLDTKMILGNRDLVDANGEKHVEISTLDTRSIGWVPTALTTALILAAPVPWVRRGWAWLWGLFLIHGFILFSLQVRIWNLSPNLSLTTLTPWEKQVLDGLDYTLLTQLGPSFSVPVLIWILVTFRHSDIKTLNESTKTRAIH